MEARRAAEGRQTDIQRLLCAENQPSNSQNVQNTCRESARRQNVYAVNIVSTANQRRVMIHSGGRGGIRSRI